MAQIVACNEAELADGQIVEVTAGPVSLAVARCADRIYALHNSCPHKGGPLSDGSVSLRRAEIICPWHRFRFDLATGRSITNPEVAVRTFPVRVVDGAVIVDVAQDSPVEPA